MKPFAEQSYDEQLAHLGESARRALPQFGLQAASVEPILYGNNAVFRVNHGSASYALRLHRPGHKRIEWIRSELRWLQLLHDEAGLQVPRPATTVEGEPLASVPCVGLEHPLQAALLDWLDGTFYDAETIALEDVQRAGGFLAQLHTYAARFVPLPDFVRPRLDWEGLFGENSPYHPGEGERIFTPEQRIVFAEVEVRIRSVMAQLGETSEHFSMIHADFLPQNYLFNTGGVGAIDFDDCAWGYFLYDLATALWWFRPQARFPAVRQSLFEGYAAVRPLPDESFVEAFSAARHFASIRWQAGHLHHPQIRERAAETIARRTEDLRRFLKTGVL